MHYARGNIRAEPDAERGQHLLEEIAGGSGDAEDGLEDTQGDDEEQGRAKDGMKGDAVDAARPLGGQRTAVEALVLNLGHAARTADLALLDAGLHYGKQRGLGGGGLDADEAANGIHADAGAGADHGDRRVEGLGQREGVEIAIARGQNIGHVDDHQRGQFVRDDLAGQSHLAMELGGIEDEEDCLGTCLTFNLSTQRTHSDALVLG